MAPEDKSIRRAHAFRVGDQYWVTSNFHGFAKIPRAWTVKGWTTLYDRIILFDTQEDAELHIAALALALF